MENFRVPQADVWPLGGFPKKNPEQSLQDPKVPLFFGIDLDPSPHLDHVATGIGIVHKEKGSSERATCNAAHLQKEYKKVLGHDNVMSEKPDVITLQPLCASSQLRNPPALSASHLTWHQDA